MDDEPATETVEATYRARCGRGDADRTLRDIAAAAADASGASIRDRDERAPGQVGVADRRPERRYQVTTGDSERRGFADESTEAAH